MTALAQAAAHELTPVVEAFSQAPSPLPRADLATLAQELGWRLLSDRAKGMTFLTGLGSARSRADVVLVDDHLGEIKIAVTDRAGSGSDASLRAAEQAVLAAVTATLGEPSGALSGRARTFWELDAGGRLVVQRITDRVLLIVLGRRYADIERAEARLGVDPDRVVGRDREPP